MIGNAAHDLLEAVGDTRVDVLVDIDSGFAPRTVGAEWISLPAAASRGTDGGG